MNIFSVLFYFALILNFTTSYVLLAANMDDFRSIAKQFVPDSMADDILEMAKAALERDKSKTSNAQHFRNEPEAPPPYEERSRSIRKKLVNKPRDGTTSKYELTLDDLVEKVKQRLQSEIAIMAASTAKKKGIQHDVIPNKGMPSDRAKPNDSPDVQETNRSPNREKTQGRYNEQPSMVEEKAPNEEEQHEKKVKPRRKKPTQDKRYVAEMFAAPPPKYLYDLGKPVTIKEEDIPRLGIPKIPPQQHNNKKSLRQHKRVVTTRRRVTTTTEASALFKGIDLASKNDSYEDYVIPKKDEGYDEPETKPSTHKTVQKNPYIQKQPLGLKSNQQQEVLDVFSDEDKATIKVEGRVNNEDETVNYNKKKTVIKNVKAEKGATRNSNKYFIQRPSNGEVGNAAMAEPLAAVNAGHQIEPYEEQVEETDNVEEFEQPVTEELKARSEIISYNDNSPITQETPQINKNHNGNKNKKNQKPKLGTVIPKRDGYKMSSPNYLVKLPIVGEKYHFDEPIPEEDREPEKLDPMKNLKSIINGKVVLL